MIPWTLWTKCSAVAAEYILFCYCQVFIWYTITKWEVETAQEGPVRVYKQFINHLLYEESRQITSRCQCLGNPKAINTLIEWYTRYNFTNCVVQVCVWRYVRYLLNGRVVEALYSLKSRVDEIPFKCLDLFQQHLLFVLSFLIHHGSPHNPGYIYARSYGVGGVLGCKMCGRFCKAKKLRSEYQRSNAQFTARLCCLWVRRRRKKKNSLLLINTGHLVVRLPTRQLSHPVLTDPTLLCIWCFLGMEEAMSFPRVGYGRYSGGPCVLFRLFSLLCLKYCQ